MVDEKLHILLARLRDFHDNSSAEIDKYLGEQSKEVLATADPSNIVWTAKTGAKGPFDLCDSKINGGNENYKTLLRDLNASSGTKRIGGKFYWVFTDGANIGRK